MIMRNALSRFVRLIFLASFTFLISDAAAQKKVTFPSGELVLHADLFKPDGSGPFPTVIWYHGGGGPKPGLQDDPNAARIAPAFTGRGYVLLYPHRLGYGRSPRHELVDTYVPASREMRDKLQLELIDMHMKDVAPTLSFLKTLPYVERDKIAVAGCSLGGIQTVLLSETNLGFRTAVAFAAAAQSWPNAPDVRERMTSAVRKANRPILFAQAENDYSLTASETLAAEMKKIGKPHKRLIFPSFGSTAADGHAFCTRAPDIWAGEVFSFLDESLRR
jgi:carboxymethylenebutenolidase